VKRTLQITFMGNSEKPEFLQATDHAFLVAVVAGSEASCTQDATITGGTMARDGINTVWTIPANLTTEGTYIVCYNSTANGAPVRVSVPENLTIYALQSPVGIFLLNLTSPTVYSGEQFYLMFDTAVTLSPVLSFDSDAETRDAV
ncbi:hemagluttinin family protein, partial [Trypanosoma theileri]